MMDRMADRLKLFNKVCALRQPFDMFGVTAQGEKSYVQIDAVIRTLSLSKRPVCLSKRPVCLFVLLALLLSCSLPSFAQKSLKMVREGNKNYDKGDYKEAEINYRKAMAENATDYKAQFNLGDAMYKQKNYDEASRIFENIAKSDAGKDVISKAYHNLGNTLLQQKKYEESIEAYKNSLRVNPGDMDTKYNLEYAKKMLKQQQQQQQQQSQNQQNKDQNKDQNKEQNDKNKEQQNKDKQNKDQQNKDKEKQQQQQQQQGQISKEDAERMLNALMNQEKNTREKLEKEKEKGTNSNFEKNW